MRCLTVLLLMFALFGCGYHLPGTTAELPGGVKTLHLPLFINQTAEPRLESLLNSNISEVFARNANISQIENLQQAEAVFEGVISSYQSRAIAYDSNDDISEYRATMVVAAKLLKVDDGRLLWQGSVSWDEEFLAANDKSVQEDLEREAIEEISLRIAEELLSRLFDNF